MLPGSANIQQLGSSRHGVHSVDDGPPKRSAASSGVPGTFLVDKGVVIGCVSGLLRDDVINDAIIRPAAPMRATRITTHVGLFPWPFDDMTSYSVILGIESGSVTDCHRNADGLIQYRGHAKVQTKVGFGRLTFPANPAGKSRSRAEALRSDDTPEQLPAARVGIRLASPRFQPATALYRLVRIQLS